ncbi:MAG: domain fused to wHTH, Ig, or Glycine-rich motif [Bacteroidetes bacterium]|nr:domain fused to wHTH, Ig, or Glycine-rich motif [Bacteroidota bacterium]
MLWLSKIIKKIMTGANPGQKYMPALVRQPNMRQKELEERIADRSSLSEGDVANVIKNMGMEMAQAFANGRSVETEFGLFQVQLQVKTSETLEEVSTDNVIKVNVRFYPSKSSQKVYQKGNNQMMFVDVTPQGHQEKTVSTDPVNP